MQTKARAVLLVLTVRLVIPESASGACGSYLNPITTNNRPQQMIYKTDNVERPIPTGDWWTTTLNGPFNGQTSAPLAAYPCLYRTKGWGLSIVYPSIYVEEQLVEPGITNAYVWGRAENPDIFIGSTSFVEYSGEARVHDYGDFSVTVRMGKTNASPQEFIEATLVHGSPFAYCSFFGCQPRIYVDNMPGEGSQCGHPTFDVVYTNAGVLVIRVNKDVCSWNPKGDTNVYYGLFAATNTTWSVDSSSISAVLPGEDGTNRYLSVALFPHRHNQGPTTNEIQLMEAHAYAFVTNTSVEMLYDEVNATVHQGFRYETVSRQNNQTQGLFGLLPHHWKHSQVSPVQPSYKTLLGDLLVVKADSGNSVLCKWRFHGMVPEFPAPPETLSTNFSNWSTNCFWALYNHSNEGIRFNTNLSKPKSYERGKELSRFSRMIATLSALCRVGDSRACQERSRLVGIMRNCLTNELTYSLGKTQGFFGYETNWAAIIHYPDEPDFHDADKLNDHHFHYGYWLHAIAICTMHTNGLDDCGNLVNLIARDYANPYRGTNDPSPHLPWLRHFDPWAGHSWASGIETELNLGADQESSSEAMNAWAALYLWGLVTRNPDFRDAGVIGYTIEASAIREYWLDADGTNFPEPYRHTRISHLFSGRLDMKEKFYSTNWPVYAWGINMLPSHPLMTYQGYDYRYQTNDETYFDSLGTTVPPDGSNSFLDIHLCYRAWCDPDWALARFNPDNMPANFGNSWANTYFWIHALKSLGRPYTAIWADKAWATVFQNGSNYTAVMYNPGTNASTVRFYKTEVVLDFEEDSLRIPAVKLESSLQHSAETVQPRTTMTSTWQESPSFLTDAGYVLERSYDLTKGFVEDPDATYELVSSGLLRIRSEIQVWAQWEFFRIKKL